MENTKVMESISRKLGVLIALNLISMNSKSTITEKIEMLDRFGLTGTEIAEILNTSVNSVHVMKSRIKNNKKK